MTEDPLKIGSFEVPKQIPLSGEHPSEDVTPKILKYLYFNQVNTLIIDGVLEIQTSEGRHQREQCVAVVFASIRHESGHAGQISGRFDNQEVPEADQLHRVLLGRPKVLK